MASDLDERQKVDRKRLREERKLMRAEVSLATGRRDRILGGGAALAAIVGIFLLFRLGGDSNQQAVAAPTFFGSVTTAPTPTPLPTTAPPTPTHTPKPKPTHSAKPDHKKQNGGNKKNGGGGGGGGGGTTTTTSSPPVVTSGGGGGGSSGGGSGGSGGSGGGGSGGGSGGSGRPDPKP